MTIFFATLPEPEETTLQRMVAAVQGYSREVKNEGFLQDSQFRGTMEPENFPFDTHVIDDDAPDIFSEPSPPEDAATPKASDPAVQPQGHNQPASETQPSPPADKPKDNAKGQKSDA